MILSANRTVGKAMRLLWQPIYLFVCSPLNFCRAYLPLLGQGRLKSIVATESRRFGFNQFWYHTFYKLTTLYGFARARRGYLFFEGLGQWNAENFYIDYLAYLLYGKLGGRWNVVLVNILMAGSIAWALAASGQVQWQSIVVFTFLIVSSPYYTDIFVFLVKPEIWGWPFLFLALVAATMDLWVLFFLLGSCAILANFTVGLLLVFVSAAYCIGAMQINVSIVSIYIFYGVYTLWRMLPSLRAGSHKRLYEHINKEETKSKLTFNFWQWFFLGVYLLPSFVWYYRTGTAHPALAVVASSAVVYFIFYRIIMFGDYHTIFRLLLITNR